MRGGAWDPFEALFLAFLPSFALHSDLVIWPLEEAGAVPTSLSESQARCNRMDRLCGSHLSSLSGFPENCQIRGNLILVPSPKTWLTSQPKPPYPTQPSTSTWLLLRQTCATASLLRQHPSPGTLIFYARPQHLMRCCIHSPCLLVTRELSDV